MYGNENMFKFDTTQQNCIHFPDLAEIKSGYLTGTEDIKTIPTEFVFATMGIWGRKDTANILKSLGFKEVGAMKNWHWIHHNEWNSPIRLFFQHLNPNAKPQKVAPRHFSMRHENSIEYHKMQCDLLQLNGCGIKVTDKPTRHNVYRYFALVRMPLKPSKRQLRWLKYANYRLIARGTLATFWCNGWENAAEWSVAKEQKFWRDRGISFLEKWDFTYRYLTPEQKKLYVPGTRAKIQKYIAEGGNPHTMFIDLARKIPLTTDTTKQYGNVSTTCGAYKGATRCENLIAGASKNPFKVEEKWKFHAETK